jgi:hypothetical protein
MLGCEQKSLGITELERRLKGIVTTVKHAHKLCEQFNTKLHVLRQDKEPKWHEDKHKQLNMTWKQHAGSLRYSWWQWRLK